MSERARNAGALVGWTAFLALALAGLHALGDGPLAAPPRGDLRGWLRHHDAATAGFALLRVALLGTGWYLLLSTVLATFLRMVRADVAAGAVEACTPGPVRRLVRAAAGLSMAASVVAVSAAAASEGGAPVMRRLPEADVRSIEDTVPSAPAVTMTRLPDEPAAAEPPELPDEPSVWVVRPGDHLWSIAARTLASAWQTAPTDDEVDPYWRRLVEANRHRLPDPGNADWIVPELPLEVPPPPPPPRPAR